MVDIHNHWVSVQDDMFMHVTFSSKVYDDWPSEAVIKRETKDLRLTYWSMGPADLPVFQTSDLQGADLN